jgi:hypothetical protein
MIFMRPLCVIVLLFVLCIPAHGQNPKGFAWEQSTEKPEYWGLRFDGVQVGIWSSESGIYRPYDATTRDFGDAVDIPIEPPIHDTTDWRTHGVTGIKSSGLTRGGDADDTPVGVTSDAPAAPAPTFPAYEKMGSWTVVAKDKAVAARVVNDLKTSPALSHWRATYSARARAYTPDSFALKPFKLSVDTRFQESGVVIILQPAPDETDSAPVQKIYGYDGPESLNARLHELNLKYDPNATDEAEPSWSRLHVGLGVGAGVAGLFSLFFGGLLKWRHS